MADDICGVSWLEIVVADGMKKIMKHCIWMAGREKGSKRDGNNTDNIYRNHLNAMA